VQQLPDLDGFVALWMSAGQLASPINPSWDGAAYFNGSLTFRLNFTPVVFPPRYFLLEYTPGREMLSSVFSECWRLMCGSNWPRADIRQQNRDPPSPPVRRDPRLGEALLQAADQSDRQIFSTI
jgi:hypothetical protein